MQVTKHENEQIPQAWMKKQIEDNMTCVATIWVGVLGVNARLQCMKSEDNPNG